jgi:hypothetical protein
MRSNKRIGVSDDPFNTFFPETKAGENVPPAVFIGLGQTASMKCVPNGRPAVPSGADQYREGGRSEQLHAPTPQGGRR